MLFGKRIVVGVSGGIACYKACELVSRLKKLGAEVDVIMTKHACEFVSPLTFQTLAKSTVVLDEFAAQKEYDIKHISLAKKADLFVVAPATANVIAKFAQGIADDMLSTTFLACNAKKLICPAMNTGMLDNPATVENIALLKERGVKFLEADEGILACGDVGRGRMAEPCDIVKRVEQILMPEQDFEGRTVLISAGATEEDIDGVRVITNRSSGKMGMALASAFSERGAEVILVVGHIKTQIPRGVKTVIEVGTTEQMLNACVKEFANCDIAVLAAAPSDYRPLKAFDNKLKGERITIEFVKNPDIAANLGKNKGERKLVIFAAETQNLLENAREKLLKKNADLVVANDVTKQGAGFDVDTNIAAIIDRDGNMQDSGLVSKAELADMILNRIKSL